MDDILIDRAVARRFKILSNKMSWRDSGAATPKSLLGTYGELSFSESPSLVAACAVAIAPSLATGFRCPLAVVGKVAARCLATLVASARCPLAVIGKVT